MSILKFTVRFTADNPATLYYDVEVEAENEVAAIEKAEEETDLDAIDWEESEGNHLDTNTVTVEVVDP